MKYLISLTLFFNLSCTQVICPERKFPPDQSSSKYEDIKISLDTFTFTEEAFGVTIYVLEGASIIYESDQYFLCKK